MQSKKDFDYACGWNRYVLRLLGIWPELERKGGCSEVYARYQFLLPVLIIICFVIGPQSVNLLFIWGDLDLMVENLSTANIPVSMALLKLLVFRYHLEDMRGVMKAYRNDWYSEKTFYRREAMLNAAKLSRRMSLCGYILLQGTIVFYTCLWLFMNLQKPSKAERRLFYASYFPYDTTKSPAFELSSLGQIIAAIYAASTYSSVDGFVSAMLLHVCAQFVVLQNQLVHLVGNDDQKIHVFWSRLTIVVQEHKDLIRITETIERSFNKVLLVQMLACTGQLCFQGFQVLSTIREDRKHLPIFEVAFLLIYVGFIMAHLYIYCYVGEMLLIESNGLGFAAYDCKWYDLPARDARVLMILVHRSTIPLRITAGKFCIFSLELFAKIIKTSAGYLSVLLTTAGL